MSQSPSPSLASSQKPTNFRWIICALLFYATTVNYIDRSIFGVLASDLQKTIGWEDYQFGLINAGFTLAYAIGFIIMGWLIDKVGTRIGYALAIVVWTLSAAGTMFARTAGGFGAARFCLGLGEAGNFPAAIKTVAEWFPQKQRATATGIFNAGSNVGAILAPLLVPIVVLAWGNHLYNASHDDNIVHQKAVALAQERALAHPAPPAIVTEANTTTLPNVPSTAAATTIAATIIPTTADISAARSKRIFELGWPAAFLITPILAAIWIFLWLSFYRTPAQSRRANDAERALINADAPATPVVNKPVKWRKVLPHRQAWAFMMGKFLTDPIWWFYLFWSGKFFSEQFGADLKGLAAPMIYVYVLADFGSIAGGWLSSNLIKKGWSPNAARKFTMSLCATLILPVIFAPLIPNHWMSGSFNVGMWLAATLIGVAAASHQGFSANIFTTTSDMFPKRAVSSVTGLGGLTGALGGMIMQAVSGVIKEVTKSYLIMFIIAGSVYVLAVVVFHLLAPKLRRVTDDEMESTPMPRPVTSFISAVIFFIIGIPVSFYVQSQTLSLASKAGGTHGFSIGQYLASIVTGDIFKSVDHSQLVSSLLFTPLIGVAIGAILGALLHGILFPKQKNAV